MQDYPRVHEVLERLREDLDRFCVVLLPVFRRAGIQVSRGAHLDLFQQMFS